MTLPLLPSSLGSAEALVSSMVRRQEHEAGVVAQTTLGDLECRILKVDNGPQVNIMEGYNECQATKTSHEGVSSRCRAKSSIKGHAEIAAYGYRLSFLLASMERSIASLYRLNAIAPGMIPAVKRLSSTPFESRMATSPAWT